MHLLHIFVMVFLLTLQLAPVPPVSTCTDRVISLKALSQAGSAASHRAFVRASVEEWQNAKQTE